MLYVLTKIMLHKNALRNHPVKWSEGTEASSFFYLKTEIVRLVLNNWFVITALQGDIHEVESHLFYSRANNFGNQSNYSANRRLAIAYRFASGVSLTTIRKRKNSKRYC